MSDAVEKPKVSAYTLMIVPEALKEWNKLNNSIKLQLKSKLKSIQLTPKIPKNRLSGLEGCYKIKLMRAGYRLVYQVIDSKVIVLIWAIDKREDSKVYDSARKRLDKIYNNDAVSLILD
ncbi:type II toxin-antitoxin system RelE family toxin [Psychrobacter jeotgali]|uniref:type II toxin-antitoxin system RelE family toxin n=1 Tax=Psychrobacter jeotgali TaxID=179010 RepID=UPI003879AF57